MQVALRTSPTALCTERLLVGEPEEEEADVVGQDEKRWVEDTRRLLEVTSVPDIRGAQGTSNRQEKERLCVCVRKNGQRKGGKRECECVK